MFCKICGKEMRSDVQFRYGKVNGRIVATDSYEIVTCDTPACPLEGVTASVQCYDQTTDAFLANPPKSRILLDAPAIADATLQWGK